MVVAAEQHSERRVTLTEARGRAPVLLADASWYGTLAAVRELGSHGVPVTLACDTALAPARWSRFVTRTVSCPPTRASAEFLAWLFEFGSKHPGHVLYPTSDDLAWLVSAHRDELSKHYELYSPPVETLAAVLDKHLLARAAREAGLASPATRCPCDESAVLKAADELGFPLLVKPRAQVLLGDWSHRRKGSRVDRPEDVLDVWRSARAALSYPAKVTDHLPGLELPLLQELCVSDERIYTVDGFVDVTGELFVARACFKTVQVPRNKGIGVCFEDAPLELAIAEGLRKLCKAVSFHGVFDAEFLVDGDRRLLIDFNPRFYNHMAFETDRGLPLAWMAYLGARGELQQLHGAVAEARRSKKTDRVYAHRLQLSLMLAAQSLSGCMPPAERHSLREWIGAHRKRVTDPALSRDDRLPGWADAVFQLSLFLRHPRSYWRNLVTR